MEPLDLRLTAPRAPRAQGGGIVFLPRSIDKVRASLPGGNIGEYSVPGLTTMMLESFGIALEDFTATVRDAASEEEVNAWVPAHAKPGAIGPWNAAIEDRRPAGGDPKLALERYPWLAEHPELVSVLDVLLEDDRRLFGPEGGPVPSR